VLLYPQAHAFLARLPPSPSVAGAQADYLVRILPAASPRIDRPPLLSLCGCPSPYPRPPFTPGLQFAASASAAASFASSLEHLPRPALRSSPLPRHCLPASLPHAPAHNGLPADISTPGARLACLLCRLHLWRDQAKVTA
jgi:hypothetical protein